jgi:hypothetical protein
MSIVYIDAVTRRMLQDERGYEALAEQVGDREVRAAVEQAFVVMADPRINQ